MCLVVIVGKYHCGHPRQSAHGIPYSFLRYCEHYFNSNDCEIVYNEEEIPSRCPDCHWAYVHQQLTPLWQRTTITKCRVLQDAEIFPAESEYANAQMAMEQLQDSFDSQQRAITQSAIAYHELHDQVLRSFIGIAFENYMPYADRAHLPWSLSITRDPFVRASEDMGATAGRALSPPPGPPPTVLAQVHRPVGFDSDRVTSPPPPAYLDPGNQNPEPETEVSRCLWCRNHVDAGERICMAGERICMQCFQSGHDAALRIFRDWIYPPRRRAVQTTVTQPEAAADNNTADGDDAVANGLVAGPTTLPGNFERHVAEAARREIHNNSPGDRTGDASWLAMATTGRVFAQGPPHALAFPTGARRPSHIDPTLDPRLHPTNPTAAQQGNPADGEDVRPSLERADADEEGLRQALNTVTEAEERSRLAPDAAIETVTEITRRVAELNALAPDFSMLNAQYRQNNFLIRQAGAAQQETLNIDIEGDDMSDGAELGRFFADGRAEIEPISVDSHSSDHDVHEPSQLEPTGVDPHTSDPGLDEPPQQNGYLNPPENGGAE